MVWVVVQGTVFSRSWILQSLRRWWSSSSGEYRSVWCSVLFYCKGTALQFTTTIEFWSVLHGASWSTTCIMLPLFPRQTLNVRLKGSFQRSRHDEPVRVAVLWTQDQRSYYATACLKCFEENNFKRIVSFWRRYENYDVHCSFFVCSRFIRIRGDLLIWKLNFTSSPDASWENACTSPLWDQHGD